MAVVLDFNSGSDGAAITAGGTIESVVGSPAYTSTAMHGGMAMQTTGNAQAIRVPFTTTVEHSGSLYFRSGALASSRTRLVNISTSTNGIVCTIGVHSDGKVDLAGGTTGSRTAATTVSWVVNTWHRIDWQYVEASKTLTVRFFLTAEGANPSDQISFSFAGEPGTPTKWVIGGQSSGAGTTTRVDTIQAVSGLSWIGPFGTPVYEPGAVVHHWMGAPSPGGFKVTSKTSAATSVRMVVGTDSAVTANLQNFGPVAPDANGYVSFSATGLSANATYYYQLEDTPTGGTATRIGPIGRARTFPALGKADFAFDFGNCVSNGNQGMEALNAIIADDPLFFFHLGDFHYYDSSSTDEGVHRANLEQQISGITSLKTLIQDVPTYYMRSDHDGGGADNSDPGGYYIANQTAAKQVAPLPALANQPTDALYYSWVVGRVRFIALDVRNMYRSPGGDAQSSSKTMLGATQKQWLKDRLSDPEPVKIILSDTPWVGTASLVDGADKWWAYDNERTEIGNHIASNGIRALLITGDLHSVYADDGTNNAWGGFPVIGAGPLAQNGGFRGGPYQQLWTPSGAARAYGKCVVTDTGSRISITFIGLDVMNGITRASLTVNWDIPGWYEWDGLGEQPLTLEGEWNGATIDPVTFDQVT